MVYFIQSTDYVKVGYTSNIKSRYKKYVTENPTPIKLLGSIKGGFDIEKKIHKQLKKWHYRGEWFHLNDEVRLDILSIIQENKDNIEPIVKRVKRDKYKHLKLLSLLRNYAAANGMLLILPHMKTEMCGDLEITSPTFGRYLSKLCKLRKLKQEEGLYYLV